MTRIICNSWPKSGTHALLELARLVLGEGLWYKDPDIKYPEGEHQLTAQVDERIVRHGDTFAFKGHFGHSGTLESYFQDRGLRHLFAIRDPREVICSTFRWLKDLRPHWEISRLLASLAPEEQIERIILGLPKIQPFHLDQAIVWDRPIAERYARLSKWVDAPDCCVLRYEDLTGRTGRRRQHETIERALRFINHAQTAVSPEQIVRAICNPQAATFHTGPNSDWENVFTARHREIFVATGGEELVERFGYPPTQLPRRRTARTQPQRSSFLTAFLPTAAVDPNGWDETLAWIQAQYPATMLTPIGPATHELLRAAERQGVSVAPLPSVDEADPDALVLALDGGWEYTACAQDLAQVLAGTKARRIVLVLEFVAASGDGIPAALQTIETAFSRFGLKTVALPAAPTRDGGREVIAFERAEQEVLVLGDSHGAVFNHPLLRSHLPGQHLNVVLVPGATASGLENPNDSKTQAYKIFRRALLHSRASKVVVTLGEVDTGFVIWYRANKYNDPVISMAARAVASYTRFLEECAQDRTVICISTPLPTIRDGNDWGEVANLRKEVTASQADRTLLTREFNRAVQTFCQRRGIHYLMLDPESTGDDGLVRSELLNPNPCDHHYNPAFYAGLLVPRLQTVLRDSEVDLQAVG